MFDLDLKKCPICNTRLADAGRFWISICPIRIISLEDDYSYNHFSLKKDIAQFIYPTYTVEISLNIKRTIICDIFIDNVKRPKVVLDFWLEPSQFSSEDKIKKILCLI